MAHTLGGVVDEFGVGKGLDGDDDDDGFQLVVIDCDIGSASHDSPFRGTRP